MFHHHRLCSHVHSHAHPHANSHGMTWQGYRALRRLIIGGALILLGAGTLLKGQGLVGTNDLWLVAPAVIALSGMARLLAWPGIFNAVHAVVHLAIAAYLVVVIEHVGGWTFAATWPVLLIAGGAGMIARALLGRRAPREPRS